ncbi:MAG: hypothetical protein AAGC68_02710 [Verrucomicrobiota bacterium]
MRLETYESDFNEKKVREVLDGVLANSAFIVFDIDGETPISGNGRMPIEGLTGRKQGTMERAIECLQEISDAYLQTGHPDEAVLQDFHTFRQALNVASADQRLLLFVVASPDEIHALGPTLRPLMVDPEVIGRFHLDLGSGETDRSWEKAVEGSRSETGFFLIRSGAYGIKGEVMAHLPLSASKAELKSAMLQGNEVFAKSEQRKAYAPHVASGLEAGIYFEQLVPYGEDRDGDGLKDNPKAAREAVRRREAAKIHSLPPGKVLVE